MHDTRRIFSRHLLTTAALALAMLPAIGAEAGDLGEAERIARAMRLAPGMTVADVGAGYGQWSSVLLEHVGPEGGVFATEVDDDAVDGLKQRFAESPNVRVVLGTDGETGLPEGCCDAILLRLVYHHFAEPEAMRRALRKALRPGGRLVVVETQPEASWQTLISVAEPDYDDPESWLDDHDDHEHNIAMDQLIAEVTSGCFLLVESVTAWESDMNYGDGSDWNGGNAYCAVFEKSCS